jgi:hypothetical protein
MNWPLAQMPARIVTALMDQGEKLMAASRQISDVQKPDDRNIDIWPVYEVPLRNQTTPYSDDSSAVIADMVSVLSSSQHGSTAEALAALRQLYPRYPLTLRLAAIVTHSRISPQQFPLERPIAQ